MMKIAHSLACYVLAVGASPVAAVPRPGEFDHKHAKWTEFLKVHVKDGVVDYAAIKKDPAALNAYVAELEGVKKETYASWTEKQQIAFWVNAYNAYAVKLIVDNFPVKSIKDLSPFLGSVFNKSFIPLKEIHGGNMSLGNIEHDVLRAKFNEPRVHFALVCASKSCAPIRSEAYRADDLDAQLEDQAKTFLKDASKNRYDARTKTLHLSKVFDWFEKDFKKAKGSVRDYVAQYLEVPKDVEIEYLDYDWSLNGK